MKELKQAIIDLIDKEIIGKYPSEEYWQEGVIMASDESKERFYQRRIGRDELKAEQRNILKGDK